MDTRAVCVFISANHVLDKTYEQAVEQLASALVSHGLSLVYGGASVGLMGSIAQNMLERGGGRNRRDPQAAH